MIRTMLSLLVVASAMAAAADVPETPATQRMTQTVGRWTYPVKDQRTEGPYIVYTPPDWDGRTPLPLLISLHGAGYRGDDIKKLFPDEVIKQIRDGRVHQAIVAAPQTSTYWTGEQCAAFIDQILESQKGRYDPDRVYLTGESSGGGGAWEGAKLRSDKLAALVPIATTIGSAEGAEKLINLPTWSFHNIHDPYQKVEKSRTQIAAIKAAGGNMSSSPSTPPPPASSTTASGRTLTGIVGKPPTTRPRCGSGSTVNAEANRHKPAIKMRDYPGSAGNIVDS